MRPETLQRRVLCVSCAPVPVVMDPVMIAKSGARLLKPNAIEALKTKLLPLATVVTPNLHEAGAPTGHEITTLEQLKEAARVIRETGPENVVVKGGHLESTVADVLYHGYDLTEFRAESINTENTHGSGCIFASAIAASLADKKTVREIVTSAKDFITAAIRTSLVIGKGYGPANPIGLAIPEGGTWTAEARHPGRNGRAVVKGYQYR